MGHPLTCTSALQQPKYRLCLKPGEGDYFSETLHIKGSDASEWSIYLPVAEYLPGARP